MNRNLRNMRPDEVFTGECLLHMGPGSQQVTHNFSETIFTIREYG